MKRLLISCFAALLLALPLEARINLFEPWYPGQDTGIGPLYSYQPVAAILKGDAFTEVPFSFSYMARNNLEVGGRWGIRSFSGHTGISDLLLGAKYQFTNGTSEEMPRVIGEAAFSLPTADSKQALGTGAVSLLLHWSLEKQIREFTGYFGLGVQLNSENSDKVKLGNIFSYHVGARYPYNDQWKLYGEFKGFNHAAPEFSGTTVGESFQELYLAPGADFLYRKDLTISGALLIGLTPESHHLGLLIGTTF